VFSGESEHVMDDKGRVSVPKRFQALLSPEPDGDLGVILTRGFEPCVFLFSKPGFARFTSKLSGQAFAGAKLRKLQRLFFSTVYELKLDASGRVLVPELLRKTAGLRQDVVMVGSLGRAEIWDQAAWKAYQSASEADLAELGEILADIEDTDGAEAEVPARGDPPAAAERGTHGGSKLR
jgi:MraZ protein